MSVHKVVSFRDLNWGFLSQGLNIATGLLLLPIVRIYLSREMAIVIDLFNRELVGCLMSRKGYCWDNAPTQSWFGSFKNERVHGERYETRDELTAMRFEYIGAFYNWRRLHSTLRYKSPVQFLNEWLNSQPREKQVA